jgi:diketogulonate reductase-like aldo/keto reductase
LKTSDNKLRFPAPIGLGTWQMGASAAQRAKEVAAVSHALEVGYRLIDTAEMYADGGAERIIGAALKNFRGDRAELTIVSKVLPDNASRTGTVQACEASIRRMGCDYLDLYLLHWIGRHPFTDTLRAFELLMQKGLIRHFGVSNLDVEDMQRWLEAERNIGLKVATVQCNQVYYSVQSRGIEFALLPWQRERGILTMAYSPLGEGALASDPVLTAIGEQRGLSAAQIALAWCVREGDVVAIPKSAVAARIDENLRAAQLKLTTAELEQIDHAFAPPTRKKPLEML